MSFPLVVAAAARLEPVLAKAAPEVLSRIGLRLGLSTAKSTASNILALIKENKLFAAIVMYDVFGAADELVKKFIADEPKLKDALDPFSDYKVDSVSTDLIVSESKLDDEMETISAAVGRLGSLENLIAIKKAVELTPAHFSLYRTRREHGKRLR